MMGAARLGAAVGVERVLGVGAVARRVAPRGGENWTGVFIDVSAVLIAWKSGMGDQAREACCGEGAWLKGERDCSSSTTSFAASSHEGWGRHQGLG